VALMMIFGLVGYLFRKFEYEGAPLMLAFVLGPMFEANFRQSLTLSRGSFLIFFSRPILAVFISIAIILFVTSFPPFFTKAKKKFESTTKDD
jgi:TctA family transporter